MRKEAVIIPGMYVAVIVFTWGLDSITKAWALRLIGGLKTFPGILEFWVYRNSGGAFGLAGPTQKTLLILGMVLVLLLLIGWAWFTDRTKTMRHFGFACMIGGAAGNLSDRMVHGFVIDFIQIGGLPVFNGADMAVVMGMLLVAVDVLGEKRDHHSHSA